MKTPVGHPLHGPDTPYRTTQRTHQGPYESTRRPPVDPPAGYIFFPIFLFSFFLSVDGSTDGLVLGFHSWVVHSPIRWVRCSAVRWPPPTLSFQLLRHRRRPVARSPSAKMATAKLWLPPLYGLLLRDQRPLCLPVVEISAIKPNAENILAQSLVCSERKNLVQKASDRETTRCDALVAFLRLRVPVSVPKCST